MSHFLKYQNTLLKISYLLLFLSFSVNIHVQIFKIFSFNYFSFHKYKKKVGCIEQLVIENDKYMISWYGQLHKHHKLFLITVKPV